jgi:hypothetical protein
MKIRCASNIVTLDDKVAITSNLYTTTLSRGRVNSSSSSR